MVKHKLFIISKYLIILLSVIIIFFYHIKIFKNTNDIMIKFLRTTIMINLVKFSVTLTLLLIKSNNYELRINIIDSIPSTPKSEYGKHLYLIYFIKR